LYLYPTLCELSYISKLSDQFTGSDGILIEDNQYLCDIEFSISCDS